MTDITDQLAQALETLVNAMYRYQNDVDDPPTREHRAMMHKADEALAAYRASKEGEKVEYRELSGDILQPGDEWLDGNEWRPITTAFGEYVGVRTHYRRPIRATWADETAQRLADNYKAASESGNLPEVP